MKFDLSASTKTQCSPFVVIASITLHKLLAERFIIIIPAICDRCYISCQFSFFKRTKRLNNIIKQIFIDKKKT